MRRLLLSACALRFFDTFLLIVPFYTVMFAEKGLSPAQIGIILFAWSGTAVLLEVPSGVLADRVSRRALLAVAQLLRAGGLLLWIVAPSFWGYLLGMMLWGLKSATFSGAFEALIYDELTLLGRPGEYARVTGRAQAARFAALVLASLGAAGAERFGYTGLIVASAVASLAAAGAAMSLPKAPRRARTAFPGYFAHLRRGARQAASLPGVPTLLIFIAGSQSVASAIADYWQLFGRGVGLPKPAIALFIAAWGATEVAASTLAHRMSAVSSRLLYGLWCVAGLILIAAAATFRTYSIALVLVFTALYRLVDVNADARFQHALAPETRATVASLKGFTMQSVTSVLMLGVGLVAEAASYQMAFLSAGVLAVVWGAAFVLRTPPAPPPP